MDKKGTFFDFATQYYLAGRFAVCAGLNPVAVILLHHAVEMYLKGCLVDKLSLADMKNLGHDLVKLCERLKTTSGDSSLDRFSNTISMLNRFEEIRYPDPMFSNGTVCTLGFGVQAPATTRGKRKDFCIDVNGVDELVRVLFNLGSVDPSQFLAHIGVHAAAIKYLKTVNPAFRDVEVPSAPDGPPFMVCRADPEMTY